MARKVRECKVYTRYAIYNRDETLVFEGTAKECADYLEMDYNGFGSRIRKQDFRKTRMGTIAKYVIERVGKCEKKEDGSFVELE